MKIILLLMFLSFSAIAQNQYLLLYRMGKAQHTKFHPNEPIRFKFKGDSEYTVGTITAISDSLVYFNEYAISPDTIGQVDIRQKDYYSSGIRNGAGILAVAGIGYVFIDWFNRVVVSKEKGGLNEPVLKTAGGFLAVSTVLAISRKRVFKVDERHRIIIVNPNKIKIE